MEARVVREADQPERSGGEDAAGGAGPHWREDGRGVHGEDASAVAAHAGDYSQRSDRGVAVGDVPVQLLQSQSRECAAQGGMGRGRAAGYWVLSDLHVSIYFWGRAAAGGGRAGAGPGFWDGPAGLGDFGVFVGAGSV